MNRIARSFAAFTLLACVTTPALAQDDALVTFKVMKPEVALELAQAALERCRNEGAQVAVAVVDRFGVLQALIRDRFAGAHTPETARRKAWTAASFRADTQSLVKAMGPDSPAYGAHFIDGALMLGGGIPVDAAGSLVGAVGVSGAPGGELDEACAQAGIDAVADQLAF